MPVKAGIFGCSGCFVSDEEKDFFKKHKPLGFILFERNINTPDQVKALVEELKNIAEHEHVLILIDQEGGRVSRLNPPHWRKMLPAGVFATLAETSLEQAMRAVYLNHRLVAHDLDLLGINVNCTPVLDLLFSGSDDIVGDRSFGENKEIISALGKSACEGLFDGGVVPIIKHIPGHGRAKVDSHKTLPTINTIKEELENGDFVPFKALNKMPLSMTAHIVYSSIDGENCATLSPSVIKVIREEIGFSGLIMTDDLSMNALSGSFKSRTEKAFSAGCDIALHCNADMQEMQEIASVLPDTSDEVLKKTDAALAHTKTIKNIDIEAAKEELDTLMKEAVQPMVQ